MSSEGLGCRSSSMVGFTGVWLVVCLFVEFIVRCCCFALYAVVLACFFFFFQAEDGIRDGRVTGVQTCALPISFPPRAPGARAVARKGCTDSSEESARLAE